MAEAEAVAIAIMSIGAARSSAGAGMSVPVTTTLWVLACSALSDVAATLSSTPDFAQETRSRAARLRPTV